MLQSHALHVVLSDVPDGPLRGSADDGSRPTGQVTHGNLCIDIGHKQTEEGFNFAFDDISIKGNTNTLLRLRTYYKHIL